MAAYFKQKGWGACAIEPSKDSRAFQEKFGITVLGDFVQDADFASCAKFSFVSLSFVLEHLEDPIETIRQAYQALEPGGIIMVSTPNDFSPGQLAFHDFYKEEYRWIFVPDHINYFDFHSLTALLKRAGFTIIRRTTDFPLEFLLLGGINYYANPEDQMKVNPFIQNFESAFKTTNKSKNLEDLYVGLAQQGLDAAAYYMQ